MIGGSGVANTLGHYVSREPLRARGRGTFS
jgi:hypothetical protein